MRFELLGEKDGYAYVLDLETGETLKSPVREHEPRVRTVKEALHETGFMHVEPERKLEFDEPRSRMREDIDDSPEHAAVTPPSGVKEPQPEQNVNPYAVPNPRFAWQDPNWVSPQERRKQKSRQRPIDQTGRDLSKVFREPGKFGESEIDYVEGR